ncbi:MAG: hypothetical protein U0Q16_17890 [Bryobacteraceae bacterium]
MDPFVGTWELDPATLHYERGRPGKRATYIIEATSAGLLFSLDAEDADGKPIRFQYGGALDGTAQPLPGDSGLELVLMRESERSISSILKLGDKELDRWTRELSADGQSITMTQFVSNPGGPDFRNKSVYRRVER